MKEVIIMSGVSVDEINQDQQLRLAINQAVKDRKTNFIYQDKILTITYQAIKSSARSDLGDEA